MNPLLLVGSGGFVGAVLRYLSNDLMRVSFPNAPIPLGTIFVNIVGCFIIGVMNSLLETKGIISDEVRLFIIVGALGGFTTFSTFGMELFNQLKNGMVTTAMAMAVGQVITGVIAVSLGYSLVKSF